jgi:acetyltransferase-like isoleucine patch superfamily enzyme
VLVGRNAVIYGHGGVTIGADSLLGPGVVVASSDHVFWDEGPIQAQGFTREPILIGEDVWLGAATVVCPGISIDSHVVVGAGSIVTQNLVGGMVYGGVPAVQLGTISDRKAGSIRRHFLPGAANDS